MRGLDSDELLGIENRRGRKESRRAHGYRPKSPVRPDFSIYGESGVVGFESIVARAFESDGPKRPTG